MSETTPSGQGNERGVNGSVESFGWESSKLWFNRFEGKERLFENAQIVATGIGGAVALGTDSELGVRLPKQHGDGQRVPYYLNLKEIYGETPETLFLVASTFTTEDLLSLVAVAGEYKRGGEVKQIIPILTAFPHERQDHAFYDERGERILQPTTLRTVVQMLVGARNRDGARLVDGIIGIGYHSLQVVRHGNSLGFPILPLDCQDLMLSKVGAENLINPIVLGPDKGRTQIGQRMAAQISQIRGGECQFFACDKSRDRTGTGNAIVTLRDPKILQWIKENEATVLTFDDEIREGTTSAGLRELIAGKAGEFIFSTVKAINAKNESLNMTAAELLSMPLDQPFLRGERIIVSDAVEPLNSLDPFGNTLEKVYLWQEIEKISEYLKQKPLSIGRDWMMSEETGSPMFLDLGVEGYQLEERRN